MQTAISNGQVTIRPYEPVDVPLLWKAARESSPEVSMWLPWCHRQYSMEESLEWIVRSGKQWDQKREFHFGIFDVASGTFVGGVGLNELRPQHRSANLGYWIRTGWTGRGIATVAASLAASFGFDELALNRIEIVVAASNESSQRVARKLGAKREAVLRNWLLIHGRVHDAVIFSLIDSEQTHEAIRRSDGPERGRSIEPLIEGRPVERPSMQPEPIVLRGESVRLEPLHLRHAAGLFAVGQEEKIWRYLSQPKLEGLSDAETFVSEAMRSAETGTQLPFAIIDQKTSRVAGSTRYLDIRRVERTIEVGSTWLGLDFQRTRMNTECKYLLLRHAFEVLGAVRLSLKTDERNEQSRRAIERLGAVHEGVLRKHMVLWDGYIRNTVYYSILDSEWPQVKLRLRGFLGWEMPDSSRGA